MAREEEAPKKQRFQTFRQIIQVFKFTRKYYPFMPLILVTAFLIPLIISVILALIYSLYIVILFGILIGILIPMLMMSRYADAAGLKNIEGQLGASGAILNSINFAGFTFEEQPVAVNSKYRDIVFRGVGRSGVVLVSEGPTSRVRPMLSKEAQKIMRILPNVPVAKIECGNQEGQVPLKKLKKKIIRQKVTLSKKELVEVVKRLRAIGGFNLPIPKGIDPTNTRPNRKAMRG